MIRDRASKRLWVKIKHPSSHTEKLTDLEAKEEKEYLQAFAAEQETKARIDVLDGETKSLQAQLDSLHPLASKCKEYKAQLASLYKRVFAGHTPAFPEEDRAEAVVADAEREDYAVSLTHV
jgi:rare lipoprotein A (peptidoglycan hydrolase)